MRKHRLERSCISLGPRDEHWHEEMWRDVWCRPWSDDLCLFQASAYQGVVIDEDFGEVEIEFAKECTEDAGVFVERWDGY